jgi:hypothetical protein
LEKAEEDLEKHSAIFRKITRAMTFTTKYIQRVLDNLFWTASDLENQLVLADMLMEGGVAELEIPAGLCEDEPVKLLLLILFNHVALKCLSQVVNIKSAPVMEDSQVTRLKEELRIRDADIAWLQKQFKELQDSVKDLKLGQRSQVRKGGKSSDSDDSTLSDDSEDSVASKNNTYKAAFRKGCGLFEKSLPKYLSSDMTEYLERKSAQQEMYNKDRRPITMEQIIRMVCETNKGLLVYDILGVEHYVTAKKGSSTRVLSCRIKRGKCPDGIYRGASSILHDAPKIFPQSSKHFDGFIREQLSLASNARRAAMDKDFISSIDDKMDVLNLFKDKFVRRIQLVMGDVGSEKVQHVTLWSVLLHFLIIIWNIAISSDKFEYLISTEVDSRWEREFSDKCTIVNGQTFQGIEESLKFLLYSCQNPKCGAFGMPANFCLFCTPLATTTTTPAGGPSNSFSKKEKEAAYQAWKLTIAAPQSTHISKFLLAFPKYVSTAVAATSSAKTLSAEAAWSMLASDQRLIKAPRVTYN